MVTQDREAVKNGLIDMGLEDRIDFLMSIKPGDYVLVEHKGKRIRARIDDWPNYWSKEYKEAMGYTCADPVLISEDFGTVYFDFRSMELEPEEKHPPTFVTQVPADIIYEDVSPKDLEDNVLPSVLLKIKEKKESEVRALYDSGKAKEYESLSSKEPSFKDFAAAISKPGYYNLIAEFKRASPSKGAIRTGARPEEIVKLYEQCGASAVSVLTDSDFDGSIDDLRKSREVIDIPILRKDFIIDPAQIYESRSYGADAILLIAALLEPSQLNEYIAIADSLGMDCVVESHNRREIEKSVEGSARIFGINNRNLHSFSVERTNTFMLLACIPEGHPIVVESGIMTYDDVNALSNTRINALLVGEAIMSIELNPTLRDMGHKIYELLGR